MSHLDVLVTMRDQIRNEEYSSALKVGRSELGRGYHSSELLVLMATAGQLGDGTDCSLDEVRAWLEQAVKLDPQNVDAQLELGHFLDAVVGEPTLAIPVFEAALGRAVDFLDAALEAINSTSNSQDDATRERVRAIRERASILLGTEFEKE